MEGIGEFLGLIFKSFWWVFSNIIQGKLPKKALFIILGIAGVIAFCAYSFCSYLYRGGNTQWEKVTCLPFDNSEEYAVKLLNISLKNAQLITNRQRIFEVKPWYGGGKCLETSVSKTNTWKQIQSCKGVVQFEVANLPGTAIEHLVAEDCGIPTPAHSEYAIFEDGSVWYWDGIAYHLDYLSFIAFIFGVIGFLVGTGIVYFIYFTSFDEMDSILTRGGSSYHH